MQRSRTLSLGMSGLWMSRASAICSPIVKTGVRADSGSWNTMEMRAPRMEDISSSLLVSSSSPCSLMEPETDALSSSRPMTERAVIDLPEPDSPTMANVRPDQISKLTPRTASTRPASVANDTLRSRTESTGSPLGAPLGPLQHLSSYSRMSFTWRPLPWTRHPCLPNRRRASAGRWRRAGRRR